MLALLAAGYLLWLRDSSLVGVRTVDITGLSGAGSDRIRAALSGTARNMTTLHVDESELRRAAAAFPVVRAIEARADFPHGMRIHVVQRRPAALLVAGSRRAPVAGDGTLLVGAAAPAGLPIIRLSLGMPSRHVSPGADLARVRVAGGVPARLRSRVHEIRSEPEKGVVVVVEGGPKLIFGDARGVPAKWAAAVAVLADPSAAGAAYVDVRIPERPAAGGLPAETVAPVAPAGAPAAGAPAAPQRPFAPAAPPSAALAAPPAGALSAPAEGAGTPAQPAPVTPPPRPPGAPAAQGGGAPANPQP